MKQFSLCLLVSLLIISCDTQYRTGDFKGILSTDIEGAVTGSMDDDGDWGDDGEFNDKVSDLFDGAFETQSQYIGEQSFFPDTNNFISSFNIYGYPNPTMGELNLYIANPDSKGKTIRIVIVDKDYDIKLKYETIMQNKGRLTISIQVNDMDIIADDLNRIYFKIIDDQDAALCGHGDFIYTENIENWW